MKSKGRILESALIISTSLFIILVSMTLAVHAQPTGPTITVLGNETKSDTNATKINSTINGSTPGGHIFTLDLNSLQQNNRWKAYVGNVTGTLTLDDADGNTVYNWQLSSVSGEVYATRQSGSINWSGINCTWIADGRRNASDGFQNSNRTPEHNENEALSHTNSEDNITATFDKTNHSEITIGSTVIGKDECFTVQTFQNDASQTFADSDDANFTELILYDGAFNKTDGDIVYATPMEQDITGFDSSETYDFQMILPEDGRADFSSSTAYYFYVELT